MTFLKMADLDLRGKRVFIRVDFNVPQDKTTGAKELACISGTCEIDVVPAAPALPVGRPEKKVKKAKQKKAAVELELEGRQK